MKTLEETKLSNRWKEYKEYLQRKSIGINTGIECLDKYLLGLGGLVNIQGETSSCKSALGLQILHHNLKMGNPGIIIDKENGTGRLITRLLCQSERKSVPEIMDHKDKQNLISKVNGYPLHIHTESISKESLEQRIAECWELYKRPMVLLFDSIQAADRITDDQRVNLEEWVYFLDYLKLQHQGRITIIVVSEKNRMSYGTQGVGGGKGSNVVDYKPETVLDIRWEEETDLYLIKVSKHRDGLKGGRFPLKKVLSNPKDNRTFCFMLEESETLSEKSDI